MECPNCGQAVLAADKLCWSCKTPLGAAAAPPPAAPPQGFAGPGSGPAPSAVPPPGTATPPPAYGPPSGYGYGGPPSGPAIDHPEATTTLVLGILGLVICGILAPFAWAKGNRVLREIDAAPHRYRNRGTVAAGRILGIIGTVLVIIGIVISLASFVVVVLVADDATQRIDTRSCETDTKTLKTAALAWNAEYLSGTGDLPTPWPRSEEDLVFANILREPSTLHDLTGDGTDPPTITVDSDRCDGEEITQLN